jgi:hypothetical protein
MLLTIEERLSWYSYFPIGNIKWLNEIIFWTAVLSFPTLWQKWAVAQLAADHYSGLSINASSFIAVLAS